MSYPNWPRLVLLLVFLGSGFSHLLAQSGVVTTTQSFSYTGQIVTWTVPTGVTSLTITARGAEGGNNSSSRAGKGALISGVVPVSSGQSLKILVGQQSPARNGGGGGSFVTTSANEPLLIAGGGGGSGGSDNAAKDGQTGTAGGSIPDGGAGGQNGQGGGQSPSNAGSGGGLSTDGASRNVFGSTPGGRAFINGGGNPNSGQNESGIGGVGGGGTGTGVGSGGGGGGYSGGGGGGSGVGGGGGSYNAGTNLTAVSGANTGNGLVTISYVPTIRYVKATGTGDGSSWGNASGDLQAMINASGVQQVWVAGGRYTTSQNSGSFAMKNNVAIYGGFVGSETALSQRPAVNPVSGSPSSSTLTTSSTTQAVVNNSGNALTGSAILDGFVITGGNTTSKGGGIYILNGSPTLTNLQLLQNRARFGAGLFNEVSSPAVSNCEFTGNQSSSQGGGLYNDRSSPAITGVRFSQNAATTSGGGVFNDQSSPAITNANFTSNSATLGGGLANLNNSNCALTSVRFSQNTASNGGGGIYNDQSSPLLTDVVFDANGAAGAGGGLFNRRSSQPLLTRAQFTQNTANSGAAVFNDASSPRFIACVLSNNRAVDGGGIFSQNNSTPAILNCLLAVNIATSRGGALFTASGSNPTLTNTTLSANQAPTGAALFSGNANTQVRLSNTILWNNQRQNAVVSIDNASTAATYSLVEQGEGDVTGTTNLTATSSPFVSDTDYQLTQCSRAVNSGDLSSNQTTNGSTDLAGNPRFFQSGRIDIGAYEYQGSPAQPVTITGQPASSSSVTAGGSVSVPVSVSGSVSGYQWYKDNLSSPVTGQNTATLTLTNVQPAQSGSYSLVVTGACTSVTSTAFSLRVSDPDPTIAGFTAGPATVCVGSPITFTATIGNVTGSYGFTLTNGTTPIIGISGNTTFSQTLTAGTSGSQTFTLTVSCSGQLASATTTLTVNALPVATLTASPSPVLSCAQTSLTLTAGGGTSYSFSGPGIVSQGGNQAVVNAPGTYAVTVTSAGCTSTTSITVSQDNTTPAASLASNGTLSCSTTSVTLTASPGGQTYRFSPGASQLGTTNQATVTTAGVYSVTVLAGNGCSSVASTTVTGDQSVPPVSIDPASATLTCASPTATLTAIGTGSFRWNTGAQTATITVTTAGIYSVTLTGGNGCLATASAGVSSDQTAPTVAITPTSGTLTCASPSLTLMANTSAPTLRWRNGATTPSITVTTAGTYSVTATGANGCSATSNSVLIESDQTTPPATLVASGELSCAVTSVTLTANPGNGLSYRFSSGATQLGTGNTATVTQAGVYSVTVTSTATGCTSTASVVVGQDNSQPTLSIDPATATLTCAAPLVLLTANTSASSLTWSTGQTTTSISVSVAGTYSVTVSSANGCMAMAQATVSGTTTAPSAPTLSASPATTTTNQPIIVTASGCPGGTINWTALGGTGQASGNTYTLAQPGNYTLSATCTLNGCTSGASTPLSVQIRPGGFAITGVSMVNCQLTNPARGEYQVQFTPQYTGQTSSPISFAVVNELAPTTAPAPYSLRLYTDNPVIGLVANQSGNGEARFAYNWLASCQSGTSPNQPPTTTGIPNQTLVQGQGYQLQLTSYFSDPDGQPLSFQASGLPAGLGLTGSVISGTPSQTGVSTVSVTALDPGGLQVGTSFELTVSPMPVSPPTGFAIVGVSTVSCQVIRGGERQLSFTPQYGGVSGAPISFSVVNELAATTSPGPYSLRLYTDNPSIILSAQQGAAVSTFRYNWLASCTSSARVGSGEAESHLLVKVLGNPVEGSTAEVEISGASGQSIQLDVVDMQGKSVIGQRIEQASPLERVRLPLGASSGVLLLRVSTPGQHQQLKLVRP